MSASGRIRAEIVVLDDELNTTEDRIQFEYRYPYVDVVSPSNTVKHEPVSDAIDPVVQHLGSAVREVRVQGICYLDEANFVDTLPEGGYIRFISARRISDAIVSNADTRPKGDGGGKRPSIQERRYDYTLDLLEIEGRVPSSE